MKYRVGCLFVLLNLLCCAQKPVEFNDSIRECILRGNNIQILEDKTNAVDFEEALVNPGFKPNEKNVPNLGVSASTFWLRFKVINKSGHENLLLKLAYPNLNEVDFYSFSGNSVFTNKMGKYKPFNERPYNDPNYISNLKIGINDTATILIRIKSGGQIMAPLSIGLPAVIYETIKKENLFIGIYIGAILIMFFYNLFIYYTVSDKIYLYYVVYILIVGLVQMCLLGYTFQMLWPGSPWLAKHSVYLLSALVGISSIEFVKVFLRTKQYTPRLHKGFYILTAIYIIYIMFDLFDLSENAYHIIQVCAMILSLYMLFVAFRIHRKKYRTAKYFLIAWSMFLIGVFVYALKDVGLLPYNNYTVYLMPVGSILEATLLSFALADRINALKLENENIILGQNILLETKVKERTRELEETNRNLEETREQLINVEKMASLGQLTAGISHEINNPINFVVSNIQPLKRDIKDIVKLLEQYNEIQPSTDIEKKLKEIAKYKDEIDLNYLLTEIDLLLKGIDEGASRTSEIVKGLKNFSRVHEVELQMCDIHEGLDSTLGILNSIITNSGIRVVKHYGTFQPVECFPGKLNQVFMNILNNAVHAVSLKNYKNGEGEITITTRVVEDKIEIRIKDNGIGISKINQSKVFEPFYTTKPVGAGTGLGLSIVYGIINSHNGTIEINSNENEGAEFLIKLPLRHERV